MGERRDRGGRGEPRSVDGRGAARKRDMRGGPVLRPATRTLMWGGTTLLLSPAQTSVLVLLAAAFPGVVTAEEVCQGTTGYVPARMTSAPRAVVSRLRRGCRMAFGEDLIETVWGCGYRLRLHMAVLEATNVANK